MIHIVFEDKMENKLKLCILGASGRMGSTIISEVLESKRLILHSVSEMKDHKWIGRDIGQILYGKDNSVTVSENLDESLKEIDAVIDFTQPDNTVHCSDICASLGVAHIIGTTGFNDKQENEILASSKKIPIVKAGNMSLGINMVEKLVEKVAKSLDLDFDVEILEMHHRNKVDSPSGTALMLGQSVSKGRGKKLSDLASYNREGITGAREKGRIGFASLRGGGVIGEHEVIFTSENEKISIKHEALSRNIFANGAIKAAIWAVGKDPGLYSMSDVLGIN